MSDSTHTASDDKAEHLPDLLGIQWDSGESGRVEGRLMVRRHHLAPNGYLHAASVIALADTACGVGCRALLPEGATFTTAELKANFLGTARTGTISCVARAVHTGRSTHVWDAEVRNDVTGKTIALFRCTQMILFPEDDRSGARTSP